MIMPIPDPDKIWPTLEKAGVEKVKKRLAMGVYARYKVPVIEEWLRRKEKEGNSMPKTSSSTSSEIWSEIEGDYDLTKRAFGRKINLNY